MQPFRLPPFEIADDNFAYQRQGIELEGESGVAQCMVKVFLRRRFRSMELITIAPCRNFRLPLLRHATQNTVTPLGAEVGLEETCPQSRWHND